MKGKQINIGDTLYYYPSSRVDSGLHPCKILEQIDVAKHRLGGGLRFYLVECSCHVDSFPHFLSEMQLYTKE